MSAERINVESYRIWYKDEDCASNLDKFSIRYNSHLIDRCVQDWVDENPELVAINTHVVVTWGGEKISGCRVYTLLEDFKVEYKAVRY